MTQCVYQHTDAVSNISIANIIITLYLPYSHLIHHNFTTEKFHQHRTNHPLYSNLRTLNIPRKHFREQRRILNSNMDHARLVHRNDSFHRSFLSSLLIIAPKVPTLAPTVYMVNV